MKLPEVAVVPDSGVVEENTSVAQLASLKSRKVTLPVGLNPPVNVAVSRSAVPGGPPADAMVEIAGLALPIVTDSFGALHGEVAGSLLASPL